jgi:ABC-type nitrate/sulfonate/bicarbonate transport system permease component
MSEGDDLVAVWSGGKAARFARLRLRLPQWAYPVVSVLAVFAVWELVIRLGAFPETSIPLMSGTLAELFETAQTSELWTAVYNSMQGWALGLGIAIALAIPLGIVVGSSRLLYRAVRVPVEFLRPIPSVALVPLAVLVYGTGLESKVFLTAFAAFWPLLIQTLYGVQNIDPVATETARAYGLGRLEILWRVKLPSAVPYIVTGIRISSAVALILVVTAELVIGSEGLGLSINLARSSGAVELMYALIIVTGLLGWVLNMFTTSCERRALHWHPSQREAVR